MGNKKEVAKQCWWQLSESEHQRDQITELSSLILESINWKKKMRERKKDMHTIIQNLNTHPHTQFCLRRCKCQASHGQTRLSTKPRCLWSRPRQALTWPSLRWAKSPCLLRPSMGPGSLASEDASEGSGSNVNVGHGSGCFNPDFYTITLVHQEVFWGWREHFKKPRKETLPMSLEGFTPPSPRVSPTIRKLGNGFNSFKAVALQSWKAAAGRCGNELQDHNGVRSSVVEVWSVCSWDLGRQCSIYPPQFPSWPSLRLHSHYTSGPCLPGGLYLLSAFPCVDPPHLPRISTRHLPNTHIFLFLIVFTYIAPSDWQGVGWGWEWGKHVQRNMFSCSHWLCKKQSISLPTCYCPQ